MAGRKHSAADRSIGTDFDLQYTYINKTMRPSQTERPGSQRSERPDSRTLWTAEASTIPANASVRGVRSEGTSALIQKPPKSLTLRQIRGLRFHREPHLPPCQPPRPILSPPDCKSNPKMQDCHANFGPLLGSYILNHGQQALLEAVKMNTKRARATVIG